MTSMPGYGLGSGNYGADAGRERGGRRRKLAAMAGSMYRAGATAVSGIKESYNQTRAWDDDTSETSRITIPGSFPDVAIVTKGNEQMVLFPSYAKRHVKGQSRQFENPAGPPHPSSMGMDEQDYWRHEWARHEDEKAIVDVDVRGWIYNPHRGPMTRRNRVLIGLARQLSGIPAPRAQQVDPAVAADPSFSSIHQDHEAERERQRIAQEAREIERRGQVEKEAAQKGGYSERPRDQDSEDEGDSLPYRPVSRTRTASPTPSLSARSNTGGGGGGGTELNDAQLAVANANLMARIGPFMTTPLVQVPITLFFYNDEQSQSRTVMTDDSGHFVTRAALEFVPTHVRVLANEDISCTEPIQIIEPRGVSLISDIDDTIKRSNISLGAKEIFRNTFVRELADLTIDGVQDWYNDLHDLGVRIHYCSNSPWQLYPVLATYFKLAGLPPGSLHLKRYTGMLQGIFEPVAERKKGTLEKIMHDFPERKFLLVGDSGEADLEVYTDLAVAYPGRIVAIFIRDVTTPEQTGYFDSGFDVRDDRRPLNGRSTQPRQRVINDDPSSRPALPPRVATQPVQGPPEMGDLIDLSEEPEPLRRVETERALPGRKPPPPRPSKPSTLKSSSSTSLLSGTGESSNGKKAILPPPPPPARKSTAASDQSSSSSSRARSTSDHATNRQQQTSRVQPRTRDQHSASTSTSTSSSSPSTSKLTILPPPPPPARRRGTPLSTSTGTGTGTGTSANTSTSTSPGAPPSRRRTGDSDVSNAPTTVSGKTTPTSQYPPDAAVVNKKLDLWRRRLERAQETLDRNGVKLYTWRRGNDVVHEAIGLVKETLRGMGVGK